MDNVVKVVEESSPPQLYHYNRYKSATVSAGLAPGKTIGDGIDAMDEISKKVLDDSFSTELTGPSRDFAESGSNILFAFILALVLIYLILAAQFESFMTPLLSCLLYHWHRRCRTCFVDVQSNVEYLQSDRNNNAHWIGYQKRNSNCGICKSKKMQD